MSGRMANKAHIEKQPAAGLPSKMPRAMACAAVLPAGVIQDGADLVERDPQLAQGNSPSTG